MFNQWLKDDFVELTDVFNCTSINDFSMVCARDPDMAFLVLKLLKRKFIYFNKFKLSPSVIADLKMHCYGYFKVEKTWHRIRLGKLATEIYPKFFHQYRAGDNLSGKCYEKFIYAQTA